MQCPVCNVDLAMSDKHGIEVDYCPKCRGIWLDRGELDKIIERSGQYDNYSGERKDNDSRDYYDDDDRRKYNEGGYKRKKKSFFDDLFDF